MNSYELNRDKDEITKCRRLCGIWVKQGISGYVQIRDLTGKDSPYPFKLFCSINNENFSTRNSPINIWDLQNFYNTKLVRFKFVQTKVDYPELETFFDADGNPRTPANILKNALADIKFDPVKPAVGSSEEFLLNLGK